MSFRVLPKLLAITLKSQRSNPQFIETNGWSIFTQKFATYIHVHKVAIKTS